MNLTNKKLKRTLQEIRREKFLKEQEAKRQKYYGNKLALPPECDALCFFRKCFNKFENKGSYTIGRGYTSYHDKFSPACGTRLNHGCGNAREDSESYNLNEVLDFISNVLENHSQRPQERKLKGVELKKHTRFALSLLNELQKHYNRVSNNAKPEAS